MEKFPTLKCIATILIALLATPLGIGCGGPTPDAEQPSGEQESRLPQDFASAVQQIAAHTQTVKDAFAAGTPEDCDSALHEVGHVLKALPDLAKKANLTEAGLTAVEEARGKLTHGFFQIHEGFHGGEQNTAYDDVASDLETGLSTLQEQLQE